MAKWTPPPPPTVLDEPRPVKWLVADGGIYNFHQNVHIEERQQRDGSYLFAVTRMGDVLAKDGEWMNEVQPSSRTEDFLALTRYATFGDALAAFRSQLIQRGPSVGGPDA